MAQCTYQGVTGKNFQFQMYLLHSLKKYFILATSEDLVKYRISFGSSLSAKVSI